MRIAVVYYSLSGTTRNLAERTAAALGADLVEIHAPRYRRGFLGFFHAGFDSWRNRLPAIEVAGDGPERYDFVLLASPIWASRAATPMRAYLAGNAGRFKRAAFVLSFGGSGAQRALDEMAALAGVAPELALLLREKDIKASDYRPPALKEFLSALALRRAA